MKFVNKIGLYSVYELDKKECLRYYREYPTFACWISTHHEDIGNINRTENESGTLEEMADWCEEYSR